MGETAVILKTQTMNWNYRRMAARISLFAARKCKTIFVILAVLIMIHIAFTYFGQVERPINNAQGSLDYMAAKLHVNLAVLGNRQVAVKLNNTGTNHILHKDWKLYFFTLRRPHDQSLWPGFHLVRDSGGLYYIAPGTTFKGINAKETVTLVIDNFPSGSKSDHSPNWYVVSNDNKTVPRIINNTAVYDDSFIEPFTDAKQWKLNKHDRYNPYPPEQRYEIYKVMNQGAGHGFNVSNYILPSPFHIRHLSPVDVTLDNSWSIYVHPKLFQVAGNLTSVLNLQRWIQNGGQSLPSNNVILINLNTTLQSEEYIIQVTNNPSYVNISSGSEQGTYYAIRSLLTLIGDSKTIPHVYIHDKPRFPIRSLMLDVSRHFMPKGVIFKVIDLLSMYKMNMLHLHLTDDEGWRIEIPSIPELTQYGSRRCHGYKENKCVPPSLGSGPFSDNSGSGYYTVSDFKDILRYASERFVKIVPEIDVPGHSLAAIIAMKIREDVIMGRSQTSGNSDPSYLLTDSDNPSAESVQGWKDNAMNPCLNSTYRFIETIITDLISLYDGIQVLDVLHLGGDEVPYNIWQTSPACASLLDGQPYHDQMLQRLFMTAAADVAVQRGLNISTWEDGMYYKGQGPYTRDLFKQNKVYVQAWNNVWEGGTGGRAIEFANAGYQTILSMATHLYLDHPYEPDPDEKGLYWATRYIDTFKIFGFLPDDIFENADFDKNGNEINRMAVCSMHPCPLLERPENIVGIETCLWSETVHSEEQLFYMLNPRLLAVAERSWYKAPFETMLKKIPRDATKIYHFGSFLYSLGYRELPNLEKHQIPSRIPQPGVQKDLKSGQLSVNTLYPNFSVEMSSDNGLSWKKVDTSKLFAAPTKSTLLFRTVSPSGKLFSKHTTFILQ